MSPRRQPPTAGAMLLFVLACFSLGTKAAVQYAVVDVETACSTACAALPVVDVGCYTCLQNRSTVNAWSTTVQPQLQRLPLYELGLASLAAIPVLHTYPAWEEYAKLQGAQVLSIFLPGTESPQNYTLCTPEGGCATRPAASGLKLTSDGICVEAPGWLLPGIPMPLCAMGVPMSLDNVSLVSPDQLAMFYPTLKYVGATRLFATMHYSYPPRLLLPSGICLITKPLHREPPLSTTKRCVHARVMRTPRKV